MSQFDHIDLRVSDIAGALSFDDQLLLSAGVAAYLRRDDTVLTDVVAISAQALEDLRTTLGLLRESDEPAPTAPTLDLASLAQLIDRVNAAGVQTKHPTDRAASAGVSAIRGTSMRKWRDLRSLSLRLL